MGRTHMTDDDDRPGGPGFGRGFGGPGFGRGFGGPGGWGPGGPGGWGPGGRGPGRGRGRARRGDVRAAVLALLAERPMHGYEMIQVLDERTSGAWKPSPGSIYPALQLLEDEGFIVADSATGKRLFGLTDAGRAELEANPRERSPWDEVTDGLNPEIMQLRDLVMQIMIATRQVAEAGGDAHRTKAVELLTETRRGLYAILAADD